MTVPDIESEFLSPHCVGATLDRWLIRSLIRDHVVAALGEFEPGYVVDLGCGFAPYKELVESAAGGRCLYVGMDLPTPLYSGADLMWDGLAAPLSNGCATGVLLTEVLEHCGEPVEILTEARRLLAARGTLMVTTPFVWPLHNTPSDFRRLTAYGLVQLLENAGFSDIAIHSMGGWHATVAQTIGLWINRGLADGLPRRILRVAAPPLLRRLAARDSVRDAFEEGNLPLGFAATARAA